MIWIERLSRHKEVLSRHSSLTDDLLIGRAYDNALVIDDPYIAPRHLRIFRDVEGSLMAEDMGTQNGMYDEAGVRHLALRLDGNTLVRIGQTWLRVREADFAVAAERRLRQERRAWPWFAPLLMCAPLLLVLLRWLENTGENNLSQYLDEIWLMTLSLGMWVGLWSLLSRLLSGAARAVWHTVIALLAVMAALLLDSFGQWVIFAFSSPLTAQYGFVCTWLLMAMTCLFHLYVIGAKHLRRKALIVFSLALILAAAQWLTKDPFKAENRLARSAYLETLFPPSWRVVAPKSEADFFADIRKMQARLDALRKEEAAEEEAEPGFEDRDPGIGAP
ncbi:MAG: FHA domain-containing protein [Zoogloeaceae bacterium]|jgi:hypothetical protein|nr:FHA domain-containing protein [Zoogloeaceae bacterium]